MQKRNVFNSPRLLELKKHRQRTVLNKILISLLGLLAIFGLLAYLSSLKNLNISDVEISASKTADIETIKKIVQEQIAGKYFLLFSKANIFLYPKNSIRNELQDKLKRLKNINFSIKDNNILLVSFSDREALYTWCGIAPPETKENNQKCHFMDENGYIFDEAPYFSGEVYFKFYGSADINIENPLGSYFSKKTFKQLISLKDMLAGIRLKPVALYITDDGDAQMFLLSGASSSTDPKIIFKADSDFQNIAENLETALTTEPLRSNFKDKYSSLLYIDLRFGNKVYYKFR